MIEREVTDAEVDSINRAIELLLELFKTNNINANVAAAAMETYLNMILIQGLKDGKTTRKQAEDLLAMTYRSKMVSIKMALGEK